MPLNPKPERADSLLNTALQLIQAEKREGPFYCVWDTVLHEQLFAYDPNVPWIHPLFCPQFPLTVDMDTVDEDPNTPSLPSLPPSQSGSPIRRGPIVDPAKQATHASRRQTNPPSPEGRRMWGGSTALGHVSPMKPPIWFHDSYRRRRVTRIPDFVVFLCKAGNWPSKRLVLILEAKKPTEDMPTRDMPARDMLTRNMALQSEFSAIHTQVREQARYAFDREDCNTVIGAICCVGTAWQYFEIARDDLPPVNHESDPTYAETDSEGSEDGKTTSLIIPAGELRDIFGNSKWLDLEHDKEKSKAAFQAIGRRVKGMWGHAEPVNAI